MRKPIPSAASSHVIVDADAVIPDRELDSRPDASSMTRMFLRLRMFEAHW